MVENSELARRIANEIAAQILSGEVESGAHLSTHDLATRFAVSRTPVRSALSALEAQGLVRQNRNRGYFVEAITGRAKTAALKATASPATDAPKAYYNLAEDWLKDLVPEDTTENFLLDRYNLSRSELTAVLTRASSEGWIERKPGYGWRLLPVAKTPAAQSALYRMRMLIEPAAFLEPTFTIDRANLERLRSSILRTLDGARREWPTDWLHATGVRFHEDLMRMSGNMFLYQTIVRLNRMRRLLEYRSMVDRARIEVEANEHLQILEPLFAGDLIETSFRMRAHVGRALDRKRPTQFDIGFEKI